MAITVGDKIKAEDMDNIGGTSKGGIMKGATLTAAAFKELYNAGQRIFCYESITIGSGIIVYGALIIGKTITIESNADIRASTIIAEYKLLFTSGCYLRACHIETPNGDSCYGGTSSSINFWECAINIIGWNIERSTNFYNCHITVETIYHEECRVDFYRSHVSVNEYYQNSTGNTNAIPRAWGCFMTIGDYLYYSTNEKLAWDEKTNTIFVDTFMIND